jgi:glycosyltransferase involved in cell wall biosynthesis
MQALLRNRNEIFELIDAVKTCSPKYFEHIVIPNHPINEQTISIIMTASNRSAQTYYTFDTFARSSFKDIHVVVVDDSDSDPLLEERLRKYPFYIDFIKVKRQAKIWHNPCVNYNVGFQHAKGSKVIIQNAEVCHVGDILQYTADNVNEFAYHVFDVVASNGFASNNRLKEFGTESLKILEHAYLFQVIWYQGVHRNAKYHFLTAMPRAIFDMIGGFSFDYSYGCSYDDNDFLLRIESKNIPIKTLFHNEVGVMGIHQYHIFAPNSWDQGKENCDTLYVSKMCHYKTKREYIEISESISNFEQKFQQLKSYIRQ